MLEIDLLEKVVDKITLTILDEKNIAGDGNFWFLATCIVQLSRRLERLTEDLNE